MSENELRLNTDTHTQWNRSVIVITGVNKYYIWFEPFRYLAFWTGAEYKRYHNNGLEWMKWDWDNCKFMA